MCSRLAILGNARVWGRLCAMKMASETTSGRAVGTIPAALFFLPIYLRSFWHLMRFSLYAPWRAQNMDPAKKNSH